MFEIINQPIKVQAQFQLGEVKPINFCWQNSDFLVDQIVFKHTHRLGKAVLHTFSVLSNQITYELQFNNQTLIWKLLKIYESPDPSC
ncbi:MAG: hypothetical protein ABII08_02895 [Candidatus Beckwithbacteria bacterium]